MNKMPAAESRTKKDPCLNASQVRAFRKKIQDHYRDYGRVLPWRKTRNPYCVLVAEIMLQQTQVDRVLEKYKEFLTAFPNFSSLADAPLRKLLSVWQGLGYNRRALALRALAQRVMERHRGRLPSNPEELIELPGIGKYTAGAVAAFAFNKPALFLDTNIRRVFIHEFFNDKKSVHDEDIYPLIEQTLDKKDPRSWYNALMDYGAVLKKVHANPNRKSAHYQKQGPFENSNRQVRGMILKTLVKESPLTQAQLVRKTGMDSERVRNNLVRLSEEGFIQKKRNTFFI